MTTIELRTSITADLDQMSVEMQESESRMAEDAERVHFTSNAPSPFFNTAAEMSGIAGRSYEAESSGSAMRARD